MTINKKKIFEIIYYNPFIKYIPKINNKIEQDKFLKHPELAYLCKNKTYIRDNKNITNLVKNIEI